MKSTEILIKIEEIRDSLHRKSLNKINIIDQECNFSQVVYEYTAASGHFELVKISTGLGGNEIGGKVKMVWKIVSDNSFPHYTPESLEFDSVDAVIMFLESRYIGNSWMIHKRKAKRYFINDGIDDIPQSMR